jgi:hypothetical protein
MKGLKTDGVTEEQQDDLDVYHALKTVAESDGGKILIDNLTTDVVRTIGVLEGQYKTLTHIELIAHCALLAERLSLLRTLTRAKTNLEDLKKLLKDTLSE